MSPENNLILVKKTSKYKWDKKNFWVEVDHGKCPFCMLGVGGGGSFFCGHYKYMSPDLKKVIITLQNIYFRWTISLKIKNFPIPCPHPVDLKVSLKLSEKNVRYHITTFTGSHLFREEWKVYKKGIFLFYVRLDSLTSVHVKFYEIICF